MPSSIGELSRETENIVRTEAAAARRHANLSAIVFHIVEESVSSFFAYVQTRFAAFGGGRPAGSGIARRAVSRRAAAKLGAMEAAPADSIDRAMMRRCIELSKETPKGELPFAALISQGGRVLAESNNSVVRDCDVSRHAELIALSNVQNVTGSRRLKGCTLYTTVEPCPMCSFAIRETGIGRVVYAIRSQVMGGHSRWSILDDDQLNRAMPVFFAPPPEIVADFCVTEAEKVWKDRHPLMWRMIKARGCLGRDP
jgi:tRNA(adenine34) deaminase